MVNIYFIEWWIKIIIFLIYWVILNMIKDNVKNNQLVESHIEISNIIYLINF
jgi:predicted PurR-regulated permease PerM